MGGRNWRKLKSSEKRLVADMLKPPQANSMFKREKSKDNPILNKSSADTFKIIPDQDTLRKLS